MIDAADFLKWCEVFGISFHGGPPPEGALLIVNNLSDVQSTSVSNENLGFGAGLSINLSDSDFIGGIYQLVCPCATRVNVLSNVTGNKLRLPVANIQTSFEIGRGPLVTTLGSSQNLSVQDSTGVDLADNIVPNAALQFFTSDNSTPEGTWEIEYNTLSVNGNSGNVFLGIRSEIIYVSNLNGNDNSISFWGGVLTPYKTLSFAISQITDASSSKPYTISLETGVYSETDLNLKPNIYISGNNSQLTVSGAVTLDTGWSSGGSVLIRGFNGISFPASVTLDFDSVNSPSTFIRVEDIVVTSSTTWDITGQSTNGAVIIFDNIFGFSSEWSYNITNCYGTISNGASGNISITNSSSTAGGNFSLTGLTEISGLNVTASATSDFTLFHSSSKVEGSTEYMCSNTGNLNVYSSSMVYLAGITLDNGTGGGVVNFISDYLDSLPTLLNGAIYTPTSISNAMNANYSSPVNYVPLDSSVYGHLVGIDNSLASGGSSDLQDTYDSGANANINLSSSRQLKIQNISSATNANAVITPSTGLNIVGNYRVLSTTYLPTTSGQITSLQYSDALFTQPGTREVGVYIRSTGEFLGSINVSKTDPLDSSNIFRTHVLTNPINYNGGVEIVVAAVVPAGEGNYLNNDAVPHSGVSITEYGIGNVSLFPISLSFPTSFTATANTTYAGFFQFSSVTVNESISFNDQTSDLTILQEVKSTARAVIPFPPMTTAQRDSIGVTNFGAFVYVNDSSPRRLSGYDGTTWQNVAYLSDIISNPTLTQGQLIIGVTSSNPVAGDIISPNSTITKDVATNGEIKLDVANPVPTLTQGQFVLGVSGGGAPVAGELKSAGSTIQISTGVNGTIDIEAIENLQQAYLQGQLIQLNSGSATLIITDNPGANSLYFNSDGTHAFFDLSQLTTSFSIPYGIMDDATFLSTSPAQGSIYFSTTSERLGVYDGMSVQKSAWVSDFISGVFTPGLTNVSGTSALVYEKGFYTTSGVSSGKVVSCTLQFSCTATTNLCTVKISSLPVYPGNFADINQAGISGASIYTDVSPSIGDGQALDVISNSADTTLNVTFQVANTSGTKIINISFMYVIQ